MHLESWRWINNQLDAEDDVFIGVSTCFGHHHAHHQENGTKSTVPVVYSTVKLTSVTWWVTCVYCLDVGTYKCVSVLISETPINTSSSASSCLFIHLQDSACSMSTKIFPGWWLIDRTRNERNLRLSERLWCCCSSIGKYRHFPIFQSSRAPSYSGPSSPSNIYPPNTAWN
jgi:hypothetical protein